MIYAWKYYPNEELEENEEMDFQLCVTSEIMDQFIYMISNLNSGDSIDFSLGKLKTGMPHHIDNPKKNFFLENLSFEKLTVERIENGKTNEVLYVKNHVFFKFSKEGIDQLRFTLEETIKAPIIYENFFNIKFKEMVVKVNIWGSYKSIPVYC